MRKEVIYCDSCSAEVTDGYLLDVCVGGKRPEDTWELCKRCGTAMEKRLRDGTLSIGLGA